MRERALPQAPLLPGEVAKNNALARDWKREQEDERNGRYQSNGSILWRNRSASPPPLTGGVAAQPSLKQSDTDIKMAGRGRRPALGSNGRIELVRQQDGVDHVHHAIGGDEIGRCDMRLVTLGVHDDHASALKFRS